MTHEYDRRRGTAQPRPTSPLDTLAPGRVSRSSELRRAEHPVPSAIGQSMLHKTAVPAVLGSPATRMADPENACSVPTEASTSHGGKTFKSSRFMGDPTLHQVATGGATLKNGDTGLSVSRIQSALADAGDATVRTGTFDEATEAAVKHFQSCASLDQSGIVDNTTLRALDALFADLTRYAAIAMTKAPKREPTEGVEYPYGTAPEELLVGTSTPGVSEAAEARMVLASMRNRDIATGKAAVFDETGQSNGKGPYKQSLDTLVNEIVDSEFAKLAKGNGEKHADPKNLHRMSDLVQVGQASKVKADAVFGGYARGKAFDATRNLRDRWAVQDERIKHLQAVRTAGGRNGVKADAQLKAIAQWRVQKIINSHEKITALNAEYGVTTSRSPEKKIISEVIAEVASKREVELCEIHKGWRGAADPDTREIFIQLFKSESAKENRAFMWRNFQTLIHEYIHTLNHSRYRAYSEKLSKTDEARSHTLREGATEYLTKTVLSTVDYNDKGLREQVEGSYHESDTNEPPPKYRGYAEAAQAEQLVGVVGASNMYAAYFLGNIELIGGFP